MRRKLHSRETQHHSCFRSMTTVDLTKPQATHDCSAIYLASIPRIDEKIYNRWDQSESVAGDKVLVV